MTDNNCINTLRHNCIVLMYDNAYEIAGPFNSTADLAAFGKRWQAENGDRLTWRSIYLRDPHTPPRVIHPLPITAAEQYRETSTRCGQHNCIILMYRDHYEIAGPFDSFQDLGAFGKRWQEENADDDWYSIYLSDPHAPPCVIRPDAASCAPLMPDGEPDELCYLDNIIKGLQDYRDVVAARREKGGPTCA